MGQNENDFQGTYEKEVGGRSFIVALRRDGTLIERAASQTDIWEGTWENKRGKLYLYIGENETVLSLKKKAYVSCFVGKENGQDDVEMSSCSLYPVGAYIATGWKKTTYRNLQLDEADSFRIPVVTRHEKAWHAGSDKVWRADSLMTDDRCSYVRLYSDFTLMEKECNGNSRWGGNWSLDETGLLSVNIGDYVDKLILRPHNPRLPFDKRMDGFEYYKGELLCAVIFEDVRLPQDTFDRAFETRGIVNRAG